jgi:quercetin dioxygenase-like cupin family protein
MPDRGFCCTLLRMKPEQHSWDSVEVERMNPLLTRQCIHTENVTLARIVLKKGCIVPEHHHVSEQFSHILEGELKFYFGDKEFTLRPGDVLTIPSNVPHKAVAVVDTVAIDAFSPPRQDWIDKDDAYLRTGSSTEASR